jgi:hypothetical protein
VENASVVEESGQSWHCTAKTHGRKRPVLALYRENSWKKAAGLGTAPRKLMEEMREVKSLDVVLPARDKTLWSRVVSTPSKELKTLLQRMKFLLPNKPNIVENMVQKMT